MTDPKPAVADPILPEPMIASLVRWAVREGNISFVTVTATLANGSSISESAEIELTASPD